jgi:Sec-independent protein translocase protein TatA
MIIIALLALIVLGPSRASSMARDLGRFASEARRSLGEFKEELDAGGEVDEARPEVEEPKVEEPKVEEPKVERVSSKD